MTVCTFDSLSDAHASSYRASALVDTEKGGDMTSSLAKDAALATTAVFNEMRNSIYHALSKIPVAYLEKMYQELATMVYTAYGNEGLRKLASSVYDEIASTTTVERCLGFAV